MIRKNGQVTVLDPALKIDSMSENAARALAESERKYLNLFQNAQVAMYRSKIDGSAILAANDKLAELFECSVDELLNKSALIKWADLDKRQTMINLVKENGILTNYEIQVITNKGNLRTSLASIRIYPEYGYLEGSIVDITNRNTAKDALAKSEKRYDDSMETNRTNAKVALALSDDNAKVARALSDDTAKDALAKSDKRYDDSMETNRTNAEAALAKSDKRGADDFMFDQGADMVLDRAVVQFERLSELVDIGGLIFERFDYMDPVIAASPAQNEIR
jgi:PAS domain S-box-containing protein